MLLSCESYLEAGDDRAARCLSRVNWQRQQRRGNYVASSADADAVMPDLDDLLGPAKRQHLEAYYEIAAGASHTDFADLAQSPYYQQPCRRGVAPALLRGSQLFSLARRRPLLPCELMVIQGIPAGGIAGDGILAKCYPFVREMEEEWTGSVVRQMAGNSMHLCQVGSVISLLIALSAELARKPETGQQPVAAPNVVRRPAPENCPLTYPMADVERHRSDQT